MDNNSGRPAFPCDPATHSRPGISLRQYAAIKLKVPNSNEAWLDDMIRQSLRDEFAIEAMQVFLAEDGTTKFKFRAEAAYNMADAMLKAREAKSMKD